MNKILHTKWGTAKIGDEGYYRESEHMKLHNMGENNPFYGNPNNYSHPDKSKMRISEYKNTTGYFRVTKQKTKMCKQGFIWAYRYYEDGKRKSITSISIDELEKKVKAKGLLWEKI